MPYAILRFQKRKAGGVAACERHNERKKEAYKSNPDIDMERSKNNYHLIAPPKYTYKKEINRMVAEAGCRTRKDSVMMVETLITASPEFMNQLPPEEQKAYFQTALDFISERVGKQNILSAVVHMDERTPHMHLCFVPITPDNKLSAKAILGNQKSLSEWQTAYHERMSSRWNQLERGQSSMETKRKHVPTWLYAGYGGCFRHWLKENNPKPYGSYGNGSAMRVSAVGWLYDSMERTREVARATANVTHNHPEGIKGAESTASAIYMARNGSSKEEIKAYIEREFHYDLSRTLDNIRTYYHHVESCQETVPEAIIAFLESKDFEDAIRNAVSLGGDTDTLGAITGSIAEAFYGIPAVLIAECKSRIDKGLMTDVLDEFDHVLGRSVDTYSDEVDETQANQMIEAAIDQYYIQQDKNGMLLFMEVMVTRMQQAGEVIVPYITENPFMSEEQISKVKAGDTISLDHDVRLKIETVKDADEKEWIGVFTSSEEMHKGSAGNVQMNQSIESILRLALNWEQVNGIVINPFGKYIQMTKKMIELLINGYEYNENERKSKDDENN